MISNYATGYSYFLQFSSVIFCIYWFHVALPNIYQQTKLNIHKQAVYVNWVYLSIWVDDTLCSLEVQLFNECFSSWIFGTVSSFGLELVIYGKLKCRWFSSLYWRFFIVLDFRHSILACVDLYITSQTRIFALFSINFRFVGWHLTIWRFNHSIISS